MERRKEEKMIDIDDIVIETVDNVLNNQIYENEEIGRELEEVEGQKRALNNKKMKLGEALVNKRIKIPVKFKKISDIVGLEHIRDFYFNLFFYGFADYKKGVGILIKDSNNFYLKITPTVDKETFNIVYKEELYATEEIIQQVINYEKNSLKNCP